MKKQFFYLLFIFFPILLSAQGVSVLQTDVPQQLSFATPTTAQAVFSHPQGQTLTLLPDSVPTDFTLADLSFSPISPDKTQARFTLIPFVLQQSTFTASFALTANPDEVATLTVPVTVAPVKLFKDNSFKEIRPPHRPFNWVLWACILLALAALICLLIGWIRRMQKDTAPMNAAKDNRPPHVIALSQIDWLLNSGLWEKKQYKFFYITLTDILRTYLQRAFGLDVSADTSAELLQRIKTQDQLAQFVQELRAFLTSGDLVKFAKAVPTEQTRNQDITLLRQFIDQTAPKPQPEQPARVEVKL